MKNIFMHAYSRRFFVKKIIILFITLIFFSCLTDSKDKGYQPEVKCNRCYGDGKCIACMGFGYNQDRDRNIVKCYDCNGTGVCIACRGSGKINRW